MRRRTEAEKPLFRTPDELARAASRRLLTTGAGREALSKLKGNAIAKAHRCECGVLVLAKSRHRECPACDRRLEK